MNTQKTTLAVATLCMALATTVQAQTLTLTPSNYNGTNVSCFGAQDGSINLSITGGTPPYTIVVSPDRSRPSAPLSGYDKSTILQSTQSPDRSFAGTP